MTHFIHLETSLTPIFVFSPPFLDDHPSFENACRLYREGDISWQSRFATDLPEFRFCDEFVDPLPPKPLIPLPESSFVLTSIPPFRSTLDRIHYCLIEAERGSPSQEMKDWMLSNCELILEIVEANKECNSSVLLLLDNWCELGTFVFAYLLRRNFDVYFNILESLSLTWNRFRCYMSLLASHILSIEDTMSGMLTRLLMIENKEEAV